MLKSAKMGKICGFGYLVIAPFPVSPEGGKALC